MSDAVGVGFDLDMTLVDSRPVSRRALERLVSEHGHDLDVEALIARYGLPLSGWLPAGSDAVLFRAIAGHRGSCIAAGGAGRRGSRSAVRGSSGGGHLSSGRDRYSDAHRVGLVVDQLCADVWGNGKVKPLRQGRCWAFVGDHGDDMSAARDAGAIAVGVATGTSRPVGADVELQDLTPFPAWLADHSGIRRHSL